MLADQSRYQQIVESVREGLYTVDTRACITFVNVRLAQMLGHPRESLIGRSIFRYVVPTDRGKALSRWRHPGREGEQWEMRLRRADGTELWTLASGRPLLDPQGKWLGTLGVVSDISARKQLELQLLQAQAEKQRFCQEVLAAVTGGKFHLVEAERLPPLGEVRGDLKLDDRSGYQQLLETVQAASQEHGVNPERVADFVLAISEAVANAVKHGRVPHGQLGVGSDRMMVRITDRGEGIRTENLPASILRPGFSTAVSLGMGYAVMLELSDGIWLATGPEGTSLQLEKLFAPPPDAAQALIDRFS